MQNPPIKPTPRSKFVAPFQWIEWVFEWCVFIAGKLAFFKLLECLGRLSVVVAVIFWLLETPYRRQADIQRNWTILTQKGGGRELALAYLVKGNRLTGYKWRRWVF